jgi:peptidoglycan/xylan/chitin deacetylase (PgdA/CDA1 family)
VSPAKPFRVALTFDAEHPDRPARSGNDLRLLDALARLDVRSTVFIQGRWAEAYPAVARRIATDGHLVGHHSHYRHRSRRAGDPRRHRGGPPSVVSLPIRVGRR